LSQPFKETIYQKKEKSEQQMHPMMMPCNNATEGNKEKAEKAK